MANYYFRNTGADWNTASNWSLTDGGGATGVVPTASDVAYITLNSSSTCIITTPVTISGLICTKSGTTHGSIKSATAGTKVQFNVTGQCNIGYMDFTDIDASGGRPIYTFNGVISNCVNIINMTDKVSQPNTTISSIRVA